MFIAIKRSIVLIVGIINIFIIALKCYNNIPKSIKAINRIFKFRNKAHNHSNFPKYYHANNNFFMSLNIPGFPSKAFNTFFKNELNLAYSFNEKYKHLQLAVFAITNQCLLKCEHCYEWNRMNRSEYLSLEQLKIIQKKIESYGVCQIQYSGGEPMIRINDLIELIKSKSSETQCWIFSSGYNLTFENTLKLKYAGLTGIILSLDHWNKKKHNHFRGSDKAFDWVISAAENIKKADLALSLSLCPSREFVSYENLFKYLKLAHELHAGFIQILEPKKAGKYSNLDISLFPHQLQMLEDFMISVNNNPEFRRMPTVILPGYHQRKFGCSGAGHRFIYIDSKGEIHACPFCQDPAGNCLDEKIPELIERLKMQGCHEFDKILEI